MVVLPIGNWNRVTQHGLSFALRISKDIRVVQVRTESVENEILPDIWTLMICNPAARSGLPEPKLVILQSDFRQFFLPLIDYVRGLEAEFTDRDIVVVIPDLVLPHWYENILHNNRGTFLRRLLRVRCGSRVVIVNTPYHAETETIRR